eukprot:15348831-Ditylum_brightwellii.AAC.2
MEKQPKLSPAIAMSFTSLHCTINPCGTGQGVFWIRPRMNWVVQKKLLLTSSFHHALHMVVLECLKKGWEASLPSDFVNIDANKDWKISHNVSQWYSKEKDHIIDLGALWVAEDKNSYGYISHG